jgi:hypothetical protein
VARRSEVLQQLLSDRIVSTDLLQESHNFFKIICYTNAAVAEWNKIVRKLLFGEASTVIHEGEIFIVKAPVYEYVEGRQVKLFFTNQYIRLDQVELIKVPLIDRVNIVNGCVKFPGIELEFFALTATNRYGQEKTFLHPTGRSLKILTQFMMGWWAVIDKQTDPAYRKIQYNYFEKTLFAYGLKYKEERKEKRKDSTVPFTYLVMPSYAVTAHNIQGGSVENVVVDWEDIQSARSMDTRCRLSYVAASRAKSKLYICTSDDLSKNNY